MEQNNIIRVTANGGDPDTLIGKASDLANEVKKWIEEDLYRNPCENGRSFKDDEFECELNLADDLDKLWLTNGDNNLWEVKLFNNYTAYTISLLTVRYNEPDIYYNC